MIGSITAILAFIGIFAGIESYKARNFSNWLDAPQTQGKTDAHTTFAVVQNPPNAEGSLGVFPTFVQYDQPTIINFGLCENDDFDGQQNRCMVDQRFFPGRPIGIRVSFDFIGTQLGTPFTRRWFRNGIEIGGLRRRDSTPWLGNTYIGDQNGLEEGNWSLVVETLRPNHVWRYDFVISE